MALNNLGLGFVFEAKDEASPTIRKVGSELDKLGDKAKESKKHGREAMHGGFLGGAASGELEHFRGKLEGIGDSYMDLLKESSKLNAELGRSIALVAGESEEALFPQEQMRKMVLSLGTEYAKFPVEEAKSLYAAVGMGAGDATKAMDLMRAANTLSIAGNANLEVSLNAVGGAVRAYAADWKDSMKFADTIRMAEATGKTTVEELAGSLGRITSMSAALGLTFEETTAAIAAMTSTGIKANMAVSGLHEAFANILHPLHEAEMEAARLGIKFNSAALKAKGFHGFLEAITHSARYGGVESMKHLFASVEGFNAVMQISAGGMKGFTDAIDAMSKKDGDAKRGMDLMADTLSFIQERYEATKKTVMTMIGQAIEPFMRKFYTGANTIMTWFSKLSPAGIRAVVVITGLFVGLIALASALIGGAVAIGALTAALDAAGMSLGVVLAPLAPLVALIAAAALALYAFKKAYDANLGGFADMVDKVWSKVKLAFEGLSQLFSDGGFSGDVMKSLDKTENQGLKNFLVTVFLWANRIKNFFDGIAEGFDVAMKKMGPTFDRLSKAFERLGNVLGLTFGGDNDPQKNADKWVAWGKAGGDVGEKLASALDTVVNVLTDAVDMGSAFFRGLKKLEPMLAPLGEKLGNIFDHLGKITDKVLGSGNAASKSSDKWETFGTVLAAAIGAAVQMLDNMLEVIDTIVDIGYVGFSAMTAVIDEFSDAFSGMWDIVVGIVEGDWARVWDGMKEVVFGAMKGIVDSVIAMAKQVAKAIDAMMSAVGKKSNFSAQVDALGASATQAFSTARYRSMAGASSEDSSFGAERDREFHMGAPEAKRKAREMEGRKAYAQADMQSRKGEYERMQALHGNYGADANDAITAGRQLTSDDLKTALGAQQPPQVFVMLDGEVIAAKIATQGSKGRTREFSPQRTPE